MWLCVARFCASIFYPTLLASWQTGGWSDASLLLARGTGILRRRIARVMSRAAPSKRHRAGLPASQSAGRLEPWNLALPVSARVRTPNSTQSILSDDDRARAGAEWSPLAKTLKTHTDHTVRGDESDDGDASGSCRCNGPAHMFPPCCRPATPGAPN